MTDTEQKRIKAICKVAHIDDISDLSDGYHTFRQLYYQRMILFAVLVKQNRDKAWKSLRHEDGELCFGGGWFIVGIDTPEGSYTYRYEDNYFSLFDCVELECGKHWDGHTEKDVTRLLSLELEICEDAISRQAAYEIVDNMLMGERNHKSKALDEIKFLPPVIPAQNICEDVISRKAALDCLTATKLKKFDFILQAREEIKKLPPVTSQQKIGRWIFVDEAKEHAYCSECYYGNVDLFDGRPHNYCPNCGIKMEAGVRMKKEENSICVVTYWDDDDRDPTVTCFGNYEAAEKCYSYFKNKHKFCCIDNCELYNVFYQTNTLWYKDEGGRMTLDEAIKHAEEVAEQNFNNAVYIIDKFIS